MSLTVKRLITFAVVIVIAAVAGYFLPGMLLNYLLTGQVWP